MKKMRFFLIAIVVIILLTTAQLAPIPASTNSMAMILGDCYPSSLRWPLSQPYDASKIINGFGTTWTFGQCGGYYKKHAGIDYRETAYQYVYAAEDGIVKQIFYQEGWGNCMVIGHGGNDYNCYTTTYWHINPLGFIGQIVPKGKIIGTVYNLDGNTHFHFGVRLSSYSYPADRGALPKYACANPGKPIDPGFPEYFINPSSLVYYGP